MIKTKDFTMVRGTTWRATFTVKDERGAVVDLTGLTASMDVRPDPKAPAVIEKSSATSGIVISAQTGSTKGQFVATLVPADTATLMPGDYVWDAWIGSAFGDRFAVVAPSRLTIVQEVTVFP